MHKTLAWVCRLVVATWLVLPATTADAQPSDERTTAPGGVLSEFDCGTVSPRDALRNFQEAARQGEIADPIVQPAHTSFRRTAQTAAGPCIPGLTSADIFPFADASGLLLTDFSSGQLTAMVVSAANALIADRGDIFDFVGVWLNFTPHHQTSTAFYQPVETEINGNGLGPINFRPFLGVVGDRLQGLVMMWNLNASHWQPGTTGDDAMFTRLVLAQEFEHRFGMFLPDLLDGRRLQGDGADCGRLSHWNFKVDGQGSGMEIREWIGSSPAVLGGQCVTGSDNLCINADTGGVFSFPDLYLMGFVTADEMDAGTSELRYMDDGCTSPYKGTISSFSSADIIAAAGQRIPTSAVAQKDFRTGWIIIHQPGDPPSTAEFDKVLAILEQHTQDFKSGTLGRGTMSNSLSFDCNCNGVSDALDVGSGASPDCDANGIPDECDPDCDGNGIPDECAIAADTSLDCNNNGFPDGCELLSTNVLVKADFESGLPEGWTANGIFDVTAACPAAVDCDGSSWAYAGNTASCTYDELQSGELILPVVTLPDAPAKLKYCSRLDAVFDFDFATVRVNGQVVAKETGTFLAWEQRVIDLSPYAGQTIQITFLYYSTVTNGPARLGWQVDNVRIVAGTPDCNVNGVPDDCDLAGSVSRDANTNGVPDECEVDCAGVLGCSGNGTCVGVNICDCDPGWTGSACATATCNDVSNCSGHGSCVGPNLCICSGGWLGDDCATASCAGVFDCSGHGTCIAPDTCDCAAGWTGADCSTRTLAPPMIAPAPHARRKNRFLSFSPNNPTVATAFRIQLLDQVCHSTGKQCATEADCKSCVGGGDSGRACVSSADCSGGACSVSGEACEQHSPPRPLGWVGDPFEPDPTATNAPAGTYVSRVVRAPPPVRLWTEDVVHIGDCEIMPVFSYALSATADGVAFTQALAIGTIEQPAGKFWGDVVGGFEGDTWTPPNGLVNVNDILAWVRFVTFHPAPHVTVLDLDNEEPNLIINATDLALILRAFLAGTYPPPAFPTRGTPMDCP